MQTNTNPLNATLPLLSPRLFSFAEPNSRNVSHLSSVQCSAALDFIQDFSVLLSEGDLPSVTVAHMAMVNGNDKNQVEQALEQPSLERSIKNRMHKFLTVLERIRTGNTRKQTVETHNQGTSRSDINEYNNIKNSYISEINQQVIKYSTQPTAQHPSFHAQHPSTAQHQLSASRYVGLANKNMDGMGEITSVKNQRQSQSKSAASSRASQSKVFKKIQLKSVNWLDQTNKKPNNNNQHSHQHSSKKEQNSKREASNKRKELSHQKKEMGHRKDTSISPSSSLSKPKQPKISKTIHVDTKKYKISKREQAQKVKGNKNPSAHSKLTHSRISSKPTPNESKSRQRQPPSPSRLSRQRSSSTLTHSRLKRQVEKLSKDEKQQPQRKEQEEPKVHQGNHLVRETMQKTRMFAEMLKMMDK